jgi:putative transferase (TIGR04331 family)
MAIERRKLLALTAIEETWGKDGDLVFLGEWCKKYDRKDVWRARASETLEFHWNDRGKLRRDYEYLELLHSRLLASLTDSLNSAHQVDRSKRFWQILIDPWLLSYVAVVFDRWSSLALARAKYPALDCRFRTDLPGIEAPFSYSEFLAAANSDEWNQAMYQRILSSAAFSGWLNVTQLTSAAAKPDQVNATRGERRRLGLPSRLDALLAKAGSDPRVAFVGSTFNLRSLVSLSVELGQLPRLFVEEFDGRVESAYAAKESLGGELRRGLALNGFRPADAFEAFVADHILADLPSSVVEHFSALQIKAAALKLEPKAIVTGSHHWSGTFAKAWFAQRVERGARLIIAEHGGSLPPLREFFGFEEDISDKKATWFLPYHAKHVQLPPARIVNRFRPRRTAPARSDGYCSVIGNECPRWVHRAHFYPMAGQWSANFEMILRFCELLPAEVQAAVKVKPYPSDEGWNTRQRFVDSLGGSKVCGGESLDEVISRSRVIVCSYPETTFAEAMASDVPTLLMYPQRFYELNAVALPLLDTLTQAGIAHFDSATAAAQVAAAWSDPIEWWNTPPVRDARARFREEAINFGGDWRRRWTEFLRAQAA